VELRRPGSPIPQVRGPALASRGGNPPAFDVAIDPTRFYALEVTTDLALFARPDTAEWTEDRTYATWTDGPLLSSPRVVLPATAWTRMKGADCLFYRIRTSARKDAWVDADCSPPLSKTRSSPFIAIVDSLDELTAPDHLVLSRLVFPPEAGSGTSPAVVRVSYSEPGTEPLQRVTIVPDGLTLDIEEVF